MGRSTFLIAIVELCERFTYYGLSGPFQNYISNSYHDPNDLPGVCILYLRLTRSTITNPSQAIGLNQSGATFLTNFFQFWCYLTPVIGAVIADQYLGKYWTIVYFAAIYAAGILVLFATSLPIAIEHGMALPGLILAMVVIGLGTGGIKSNVSPLIAEQYTGTKAFIKTLAGGEKVIVDPSITIQVRIKEPLFGQTSLTSEPTANIHDLLSLYQYWIPLFLAYHQHGTPHRLLVRLSPLPCRLPLWPHHSSPRKEELRPPPSHWLSHPQSSPHMLDSLQKQLHPPHHEPFPQRTSLHPRSPHSPPSLQSLPHLPSILARTIPNAQQPRLSSRTNATPRNPQRHHVQHRPPNHHSLHPHLRQVSLSIPTQHLRHSFQTHHEDICGLHVWRCGDGICGRCAEEDLQFCAVF